MARTVNVYDAPLRSPEMVHSNLAAVQLLLPGCEVATYFVIGAPPLDEGLDHFTFTLARPTVAWTERGAVGRRTFLGALFAGIDVARRIATRAAPTNTGCFQRFWLIAPLRFVA
jgi:hypothetical protein